MTPDRLGSIGKYFPYGQERPSATTDGKEKFATYFRDSETGLDYAQNRYHQPGMGRFMTTDSAAANRNDPGSWNRYAYTQGDPVNFNDPKGLFQAVPQTPQPEVDWSFLQTCDEGREDPLCNGQVGPPPSTLPSCSQFEKEMEWTDAQSFDFLTITQDAARVGLNISGFTVTGPSGMQIAGGQGPTPGIPADQTELVLTGTQAALTTLLNGMCITPRYDTSNPNCFAAAGFDLLHPGSPGNQINFRQDSAANSMQITGSFKNGLWTLNIDIDPNNPMSVPPGFLRHAGDVIRNSFTGRDTDYHKVANDLGISPYQDNGYCHP